MFINLRKFISDNVTLRSTSMFEQDIRNNKTYLSAEIKDKSVCVIIHRILIYKSHTLFRAA